ncbi:MAG TPA: hypothetical protein VNA20_01780 [Frankiaceae bacterium]|nr:hypothetical protein [Frankiaceae bacterium]
MAYRARTAGVAALAAGSLLPAAGPATAAECVRVVVDYGTFEGAPAGPTVRCADVGYGGTAADALRGRARYKGNFLCAIDGYPESGCGDEPPSPYWSIWYWSGGRWVYSQEGVGTLEVADRDRDGHPDPFGFRYHAVDQRQAPRYDPSYPKPTPKPTEPAPKPTTKPAPPAPSGGETSAAPAADGSPRAVRTSPGNGAGVTAAPDGAASAAAGTPAAPGAPGALATVTAGETATAPAPATAGGPPSGTSGVDDPSVEQAGELPARPDEGGFPVGTAAAGVLALGLLGAAVWRFRKPAA